MAKRTDWAVNVDKLRVCFTMPENLYSYNQEHIVELRYDGKKMEGGAEGLSFRGEPVSQTQMLSMTKEYADALGLSESKRLVNILAFDDFIREENKKDGKQHKVSEDYIHSFIEEHEPDHEPYEEE